MRGMRASGGERLADLVAVGPAGRRRQEQRALAQPEAHQVGGDGGQQQRRQHLGHVAPVAQHAGDAGPDRTADDAGDERHDERERARAAEPGADVGGEAGADDELALLADVDEAGAAADDRAQRDEQDRALTPPA